MQLFLPYVSVEVIHNEVEGLATLGHLHEHVAIDEASNAEKRVDRQWGAGQHRGGEVRQSLHRARPLKCTQGMVQRNRKVYVPQER